MFEILTAQFGGGNDIIGTIIWFIIIIVFMLFGPRMMVTQTIWKLEKDVARIEGMAGQAKKIAIDKVSKKPSKDIKNSILNFMDFFAISPVDIDPYGIIKKIDLIVRQSDRRFKYFVNQVAPKFSETEKMDLKNTLAGAMTTHQIAKIVRHFLEQIKKYKIFQLGMILQMQMPMIEEIANAALKATKAFSDELPIGDSIGPLVAASMIPANAKVDIYKDEEFAVAETKIAGRKVWISKANGPGASTGYPGKFMIKMFRKQKIDRIISIDAAMRMEGEKAGSIAEGVGIAIGGTGVDRYEIEEIAVKNDIPIDAVAIKVNQEEALQPIIKPVLDSIPKASEAVKNAVKRAGKNENILIIGVGNTVGIYNSSKDIKKSLDKIKKQIKVMEAEEAKKKKKKWF